MADKEQLKSMVTNMVHGRNEEAAVDFHNFLQAKMQELVNPKIEETPADHE